MLNKGQFSRSEIMVWYFQMGTLVRETERKAEQHELRLYSAGLYRRRNGK